MYVCTRYVVCTVCTAYVRTYGRTWIVPVSTLKGRKTGSHYRRYVLTIQGVFNGIALGRDRAESTYYPGVFTNQEYLLSRSFYYPGVLTIQEFLLSRSTYYPGVLTIQEYLLSRSTYYPGVFTIQEYLLSRSTYYPGVLTNRV